ncbi:substrate-binding periplasmic protein [Dongshaea marina]|uniref:substrate-binding periplasmic protein n=1 Tax=Dongshaea marina TaxID=2047966 RepID=UPI000D3E2ECD|nr:ABC transporter substrate-binding protein [Dongshaea marina]
MKILLLSSFLILVLAHAPVSSSHASNDMCSLRYVTENNPPFSYNVDGELKGVFIDILKAASKQGCKDPASLDIKMHTWARSYKLASNIPGYALLPTTRKPHRESNFIWVGPILNAPKVLMALKSKKIKIEDISQLNSYRIGVVRNDIGEEFLLQSGVSKSSLYRTNDPFKLITMLYHERIDLWTINYYSAIKMLSGSHFNSDATESVYTLYSDPVYYAISLGTDPEVINSLNYSIDKLKRSEKWKLIFQKYNMMNAIVK